MGDVSPRHCIDSKVEVRDQAYHCLLQVLAQNYIVYEDMNIVGKIDAKILLVSILNIFETWGAR